MQIYIGGDFLMILGLMLVALCLIYLLILTV